MTDNSNYIGGELELFELATNWKAYYSSFFRKYLKGDVLEVGAGIGGTTLSLCDGSQDSWHCLEPDGKLAVEIQEKLDKQILPKICTVQIGTLEDDMPKEAYDAILYIDVIEHIEDDYTELQRAASKLKQGGRLIIIVPAHNWLFSPFDEAIGHYRRYNKQRLAEAIPTSLTKDKLAYLDVVGLSASAANKLFLKQTYPNASQIKLWDKAMVPLSKLIDPLLMYSFGKTVLGIYHKK